jgi:hypothetical protein
MPSSVLHTFTNPDDHAALGSDVATDKARLGATVAGYDLAPPRDSPTLVPPPAAMAKLSQG